MKRLFLLAGTVAAMVSCAKNEMVDANIDNPNMIKFATSYVGASTKAGVITTDIIDEVGVYAIAADDDFSSPAKYVIANTQLTKSGTPAAWSASASYYWPTEGTNPYDFYAYYPFVGTAETVNATAGVIPMAAIASTADAQVDILAGIEEAPTAKQTVLLTLDHMLSKVDFRINVISRNADGNLKVTIKGFEFGNVASAHGGLDLGNKAMAVPATAAVGTYSYLTAGAVYLSDGTAQIADATVTGATMDNATSGNLDATADIKAFLLLPQTYTPDTSTSTQAIATLPTDYAHPYIKLSYTIQQNDIYVAGTAATPAVTYYALPAIAVNAVDVNNAATTNPANTWVAGKQYTYVLTFDEDKLEEKHDTTPIEFNVIVNAYDYEIETEITNNPEEPTGV